MNLSLQSNISLLAFLLIIVNVNAYGQKDNIVNNDLSDRMLIASKSILILDDSNLDYYKCLTVDVREGMYGNYDVADVAIVWRSDNSKYISFVQGDLSYDEDWCHFKFKIKNSSRDFDPYRILSEINICDNNPNIPSLGSGLGTKGSMGTGKGFKKKSIHSNGY